MISRKDTEKLHQILIDSFGGTYGIRDISALESALSRPFQTFDNQDLYPTPIEKAASLIESVLSNHPFIDGNKRTGYILMRLFLLSNGIDINASQEEKYNFVISIASGDKKYEDIFAWLQIHTKKQSIT